MGRVGGGDNMSRVDEGVREESARDLGKVRGWGRGE